MAAVLEINPPSESDPIMDIPVQMTHSQSEGACGDGQDNLDLLNEKQNKTEKDGVPELDGGLLSKDVKIDIDATLTEEDSAIKKLVSIPLHDSTNIPSPEEDFSQEKDVPEASARVYDFNMVKQKTLPRINFRNNGIFRVLSSQPKVYVLVWTLMPISLVVCIIILILYFTAAE